MCGIVGTNHNSKVRDKLFSRIKHRGPDANVFAQVGMFRLGFARLSITGAEDNSSILSNDAGDWILFNGEIFGYDKDNFSTDTEYLFHLLSTSSDIASSIQQNVRGQFAIVFWSEKDQVITLCRDFFGERPLYYHINEYCLAFASESKALLEVIADRVVHYDVSINPFLETDVCNMMHDTTMLRDSGVHDVSQNSITQFKFKKDRWNLCLNTKLIPDKPIDSISTVDQVGEALYRAIWERSEHGNQDIGVYLSGGLDSALIAIICRPKHVFTCAFDTDIGRRELAMAQYVAHKIGANHHIVKPDVTKEAIAETVYYMDGPQGTMSPVADFALAKEASKYVKVVMGGQGADELFAGYFRDLLFYTDILFYEKYSKYTPLMDYYHGYSVPKDRFGEHSELAVRSVDRFLRLLNRGGDISNRVWNYSMECYDKSPSLLAFVSEMEMTFTLPSLVQMNDRAAAHVGIESRSPFLDDEVHYHAMRLPDEEKISLDNNSFVTKKVLRDVARGIVPNRIIDEHEKVGLHVPLSGVFDNKKDSTRGAFDRSEYSKYCKDIWKRVVMNNYIP